MSRQASLISSSCSWPSAFPKNSSALADTWTRSVTCMLHGAQKQLRNLIIYTRNHQDGWSFISWSVWRLHAVTVLWHMLSVVYEAPSKWTEFVWHEIELLSFFWRDRPYRFKVFGTIPHHPQLASCGNIIWVLAEMCVSKEDCFICSDGEKRRIGLTGAPPLHLVKGSGSLQSRRARMSIMNVMHLKVIVMLSCFFLGLSFYSVPCMSGFIFNPSLPPY